MKIIAPLMMLAAGASAFAPTNRQAPSTTTLSMGLFDFLQPKPSKPKASEGKMDAGVFGGKAARITVREDEDNAMWIEEDKNGNRKKATGRGK